MYANQDYITYIEALGMIRRHERGDPCDLIALETGTNVSFVKFLISAFVGGLICIRRLKASPGNIFRF